MVRRGELGETEDVEGREPLLYAERRQRWGWGRKKQPPKSSWRESGKVETATGTELKRDKGERRGFKFHQDSINRGPQSLRPHCSIPGGALVRRANPQEQSGVQGSSGHTGRGISPAGRTLGRGCMDPLKARPQWTQENNHIHWCWNKVAGVKPDARCVL